MEIHFGENRGWNESLECEEVAPAATDLFTIGEEVRGPRPGLLSPIDE